MRYSLHFLFGCSLLFTSLASMASHNVSARIEYEYQSGNTWLIRVITMTDPSAALVDRCTISLEVWDSAGTNKIADLIDIPRINGPTTDPNFPVTCQNNIPMGEYVSPTIKRNIYETTYTFAGFGYFQIYYFDLSRIDNMNNIPNSGSTSMLSTATLVVNPQTGPNHSPIIGNDTTFTACTMQPWLNQLNITDPDGDSLVFAPVPCRQYSPPGTPVSTVSGYMSPGTFGGSSFWVSLAGNVIWQNASNLLGAFAYAIQIDEWRNGFRIGRSTYDATVFVLNNNCVVGINSARPHPELHAYLNPGGDRIFLSAPVERLGLYDLQGKQVLQADHTDQLAAGSIAEGIYLLRAEFNGEMTTLKVLIRR